MKNIGTLVKFIVTVIATVLAYVFVWPVAASAVFQVSTEQLLSELNREFAIQVSAENSGSISEYPFTNSIAAETWKLSHIQNTKIFAGNSADVKNGIRVPSTLKSTSATWVIDFGYLQDPVLKVDVELRREYLPQKEVANAANLQAKTCWDGVRDRNRGNVLIEHNTMFVSFWQVEGVWRVKAIWPENPAFGGESIYLSPCHRDLESEPNCSANRLIN